MNLLRDSEENIYFEEKKTKFFHEKKNFSAKRKKKFFHEQKYSFVGKINLSQEKKNFYLVVHGAYMADSIDEL